MYVDCSKYRKEREIFKSEQQKLCSIKDYLDFAKV